MVEQYELMQRQDESSIGSSGNTSMDNGQSEIVFESQKDDYKSMDDYDRQTDKTTIYVVMMTMAAACGGFLFGYDTGVVSGAMLKIQEELDLSAFEEEVVVSSTIAAAVLASAFGGRASHVYGRVPVLLFAAFTFSIGAIMLGFAPNYSFLVLARIIVGIGIGLASLTAPVYIAESAPTHIRGRLLTLNTLLITVGQFVAGVIDGLLSETDGGWRWMLGLSGIPALLMGLAFLALPESPRWLMLQERSNEAKVVLKKIRGSSDVSAELAEIQQGLNEGGESIKYGWRDLLLDKPVKRALVLGCGLQVLNQLVGINTVMYYSATIYNMAGFGVSSSIWLAAVTALAQSIGVMIGMFLIERKGRRTLLLMSLSLVTCALCVLGLSFYLQELVSSSATIGSSAEDSQCAYIDNIFFGMISVENCYDCIQLSDCGYCASTSQCLAAGDVTDVFLRCSTSDWETDSCGNGLLGWLAVLSMVGYLLSFGIGLSSIPWTINAEIYPQRARSLGTSIATSVNWIGNVLVSATFLSIASATALSQYGAFWLYMAIGIIGFFWAMMVMPETAGLSLEQIEGLFEKPADSLARNASRTIPPPENDTTDFDKVLTPGTQQSQYI